jgi:hypothetical protein
MTGVMNDVEFDECIRRTKEAGEGVGNSSSMRAALENGGETTMQARKKQKGGGGRGMGPAMIGQRFRTFDPSDDKVAVTCD